MPTKQNQLFRIVQNLSSSEKAYFKKFSYKVSDKEHPPFVLFNLIESHLKKHDLIDEAFLKKQFAKKEKSSNYTLVKSKLLRLLTNSLVEYDKQKNELYQLQQYINYAHSLSRRKLFFDAEYYLLKARKLAIKLEEVEHLAYIERKLHIYASFAKKLSSGEPPDRLRNAAELLLNKIEIDSYVHKIITFQKTIGIPRTAPEHEKLQALKESEYGRLDYLPTLNASKLDLAVAKSGLFIMLGDTASAIAVCTLAIDHLNMDDKLVKHYNAKLLTLYDILLQSSLLSFDLNVYHSYYPQFVSLKTYSESDNLLKFGIDVYVQCIAAIVTDKLTNYKELTIPFEQIKNENYIPNYRKISIGYYMVFGHFLLDQFDEAYVHIQWLKNNKHLGIRYDVEVAVFAMECIILMQMEQIDLLGYQLRNFYEFLRARKRSFLMENAMMKLLKHWMKTVSKNDQRELFENSYKEMDEIVKANPNERAFLHAFDIITWLQSRCLKQSFKDLYYKTHMKSIVQD